MDPDHVNESHHCGLTCAHPQKYKKHGIFHKTPLKYIAYSLTKWLNSEEKRYTEVFCSCHGVYGHQAFRIDSNISCEAGRVLENIQAKLIKDEVIRINNVHMYKCVDSANILS